MTPALSGLLLACEQDPSDTDRYLVVADALEEGGQEALAKAFRWCGEMGKYPKRSKNGWFWICWSEEQKPDSDFHQKFAFCTIPCEWKKKVKGGTLKVSRTFLEAIENLGRVFE